MFFNFLVLVVVIIIFVLLLPCMYIYTIYLPACLPAFCLLLLPHNRAFEVFSFMDLILDSSVGSRARSQLNVCVVTQRLKTKFRRKRLKFSNYIFRKQFRVENICKYIFGGRERWNL